MSELEAKYVKTGLWTNLEHGVFMGRTLTTSQRTGNVIVALLAVFVALGTTHLWNLITFFHHQIRADGNHHDGLYRQQQAIFRTLPSPSSAMADLIKIWWLWKRTVRRALLRSLLPFLFALLCTAGSLTASIASSYVVSSRTLEVLVDSEYCGRLNISLIGDNQMTNYINRVEIVGEDYAAQCYRNDSDLPSRCNVFTQPNVQLAKEWVPCPFSSEMCKGGQLPAISLDSGFLNVAHTFGLNLRAADNVEYRKKSTCSVLPQEGYTSVIEAKELPEAYLTPQPAFLTHNELLLFHYGISNMADTWENVTLYVELPVMNYTFRYSWSGAIVSYNSPEWDELEDFLPLPEFQQSDGDIVLLPMFKGMVQYNEPVKDPLFSANTEFAESDLVYSTSYISDETISFLGCVTQYQFCVESKSEGRLCSKLDGLPANASDQLPDATDIQQAVLELLVTASYLTDSTLPRTLSMVESLQEGFHEGPFPDDQWVTELLHSQNYAWATMQTIMSDYAMGPQTRYPGADELRTKPETEGQKALCGMQKMRKSGGFVNINVFGLAFIFSLSIFSVLLDLSILRFFIFLSRFRRALSPRIERWIQDGVLQLQRRAYEAQDLGTWVDVDKEFPKTNTGEMLPGLSLLSLKTTISSSAADMESSTGIAQSARDYGSRASDGSIDVDHIAIDFAGPNREDTLVAEDLQPTDRFQRCKSGGDLEKTQLELSELR